MFVVWDIISQKLTKSAPWSETVMRRQIHIFDEFILLLVWTVDIDNNSALT